MRAIALAFLSLLIVGFKPLDEPERSYAVLRGSCGQTQQDPDELAARVLRRENVKRIRRVQCLREGETGTTIYASLHRAQQGVTWIVEAEGSFSSARSSHFQVNPDGTFGHSPVLKGPCGAYFFLDRTGDLAGHGYGGCGQSAGE